MLIYINPYFYLHQPPPKATLLTYFNLTYINPPPKKKSRSKSPWCRMITIIQEKENLD